MGQKFAAFGANGNITAFYDSVDSPVPAEVTNVIEITDAEWQAAICTPGYTVIKGALTAPPAPSAAQLLAAAQSAQVALVSAECEMAILAGFTSSALGTAHNYPSSHTDQRNLQSVVSASQGQPSSWGAPLWCAASGLWAFTSHTAAQVQQVNADWVAFRVAAQQKYANLVDQINAATSVAAVKAIGWN